MNDLNSFIINVWPVDAVFGEDTRWRFYIAAIVNSARVTLLSIVLCDIGNFHRRDATFIKQTRFIDGNSVRRGL